MGEHDIHTQGGQDTRDPLDELRDQLSGVSAGDMIAQAGLSLLTLAYIRLGLPPEQHAAYRDLPAARLLIDALAGMVEATTGQLGGIEAELQEGIAQARMAFVEISRHTQEAHPVPGADTNQATPAAGGQEPPATRPTSGLWVPGQA